MKEQKTTFGHFGQERAAIRSYILFEIGLMQWLSKVKDETFTCRVLLSVEAASLRWLGVISAK